MAENFGVKIMGPVRSISLYGHQTRKFAIALSDAGIITNITDTTQPNDSMTDVAKEEQDKLSILMQSPVPSKYIAIHINSPERISFFDNNAVANIAWTACETDFLPLVHGIILAHPGITEVWVPSQHHKMIMDKYPNISKKISVMKWGVDSTLKYAIKGFFDKAKVDGNNFYFGCISSFKKTSGYDILLKAFYEEFANEPNVKLVLKSFVGNMPKQQEKEAVREIISKFKGDSKAEIIYLAGQISEPCIDGIISDLDCLIAPYRTKAWGTPILRAMAAGVPVIVNQNTGNRSYCTRENSIQLNSKMGTAIDLEWLMQNLIYQGSSWCHIDLDELKRTMRDVYEKKTDLSSVIANGKKTAERYDWSKIVQDVIIAIKKYGVDNAK